MNLSYRISNYALRSIAAVTLPKSMRRSIRRVWILGVLQLLRKIIGSGCALVTIDSTSNGSGCYKWYQSNPATAC